jgi:nitrogenase molybdenum-iron protein alpha/beta subunit
MRPIDKELEGLTGGRELIRTDIPVGISGTFRWLHDVGMACGVSKSALQKTLKSMKDYAQPQIDMFKNYASQRIGNSRLAVFADTPLAAGLVSLTSELGMNPQFVGLRDRDLGGVEAFKAAVSRTGVRPPEDLEVQAKPSLDATQKKVFEMRDAGRLSMMLSSYTEINCVNAEGRDRVPAIELGFPSQTYHVLYPTPYYGLGGSLVLAQRMMNLIR